MHSVINYLSALTDYNVQAFGRWASRDLSSLVCLQYDNVGNVLGESSMNVC